MGSLKHYTNEQTVCTGTVPSAEHTGGGKSLFIFKREKQGLPNGPFYKTECNFFFSFGEFFCHAFWGSCDLSSIKLVLIIMCLSQSVVKLNKR